MYFFENKCIKCGQCMSVCPVYQATSLESDVARGKLTMIAMCEKDEFSKITKNSLSRCLQCGACTNICANKVDAKDIILNARSNAKNSIGDKVNKLPVKAFTGSGVSSRIFRKGGSLLQGLIGKKIPELSGLHLRFPFSYFTDRNKIPSLSNQFFLGSKSQKHIKELQKNKKGPVIGFFVGCGSNYLFPETARALVNIFSQLDARLVIPENQVCCGLPALTSGDIKTARKLAIKNIQAFNQELVKYDAIITTCASCGSHIKHLPKVFGYDKDSNLWRIKAEKLSKLHMDATSLLVNMFEFDNYLSKKHFDQNIKKVLYHDPCHLRIGQGKTKDTEKIIKSINCLKWLDSPDQCCGHGGTFNINHYDLSLKILDKKIKEIIPQHPDYIVTGCTGCQLQFLDASYNYNLNLSVCHPLKLIEKLLT